MIAALLSRIGLPVLLAAGLAAATWGGVQTLRLGHAQAALSAERLDRAQERQRAEAAARIASETYRAEEQRRAAARDQEIHDAETRAAALAADHAAAVDAGDRLRRALAAERARGRAAACHPAAASGGSAADPAADLHALVQRRVDEAADGIARFADAAHSAGSACERIDGSLTATPR